MSKRNLGRFFIPYGWLDGNYPFVKRVCAECVVVRAEAMYDRMGIEYVAICDQFDYVPLGQVTPEYEIACRKQRNQKTQWQFWPKDMED